MTSAAHLEHELHPCLAHVEINAFANVLDLDEVGGVHGLVRARHETLERVPGIGAARAAQILAAIELGRRTLTRAAPERLQITHSRVAAEFLLPLYGNRPVEQFGVMLLDTKHRVLRTTVVSIGTLDASIVHPREVFGAAAAAGAAALVLFHNHPSGDPKPSDEDVKLTLRLAAAGVLMGIDVIDHVILADARYYSFQEEGIL